MADGRRIVTKVEMDTTGVLKGLDAEKAALSSAGGATTEFANKTKQSVSSMEREYKRLVGAIDPADKAQLKYARAVELTSRLVDKGRISQEQANETLRKAETFYSAQAAQINSLGDLFDKMGGKAAINAGKVFAVAESLKAGWRMGEELNRSLNQLSEGNYFDNLSRSLPVVSGGFTEAAQRAWGLNAAAEALVGVQDDAADASDRFRANLVVLVRYGIDPVGISAQEAERRVRSLQQTLGARGALQARADALVPDKQELFRQAEAVRLAWKQVEGSTDEARLSIARKGAAIADSLRKVPGAFVPSFLLGLEQIVDAHDQAGRKIVSHASKASTDWNAVWDRARQEALAAEERAIAEDKRRAEAWAKVRADAMAEAHNLAAKRAEESWKRALDEIAAGVAPINRAMSELTRLSQEVDFARRAAAVQAPTEDLRAIEIQYLEFLRNIGDGSVSAGEEAFRRLAEILGITVDEIKAKLGELSDLSRISQVRGAGTTPFEAHRQELAELERLRKVAAEKHLGMEKDFEARRLASTQDFWNEQLGAWSGALDLLAGTFGGFFSDLQRLYNSFQQGSQAGSSIGQALGGASGGAYGGVAGGIIGIWVAAYEWFQKETAKKKAEGYVTGAIVGKEPDNAWDRYFSDLQAAQRRTSNQIRDTIQSFAEAIGGTFSAFAALEIKVRRDGKYFRAYVEGMLVGSFSDMESATEAAILAAFRNPETALRGVSDLVRQGFNEAVREGVSNLSLDELQEYLVDLREISEITWSDASRQFQQTVRHFDELWESLGKLEAASDAAAGAAADLGAAELDAWRNRIRSFTGEKESPEEAEARFRRDAELTEANLNMRIADLKLREAQTRIDRELLLARGRIAGGHAALGQQELEAEALYLKGRAELGQAEAELYQAQLLAYDAYLEAIAKLIADLEQLAADFDPENVKMPRVDGGRGAAGGSPLRQLIDDSNRQAAQAGMTDRARQVDDINRKWNEATKGVGLHASALERARKARDEAIKAANGNKEAIDRANEAYERQVRNIHRTQAEIDEANKAREREIALINQQAKETAGQNLRDYTQGSNPFQAERDRFAAIQKEQKDLWAGGVIKWREYAKAMHDATAALEEHTRLIGLQESSTLFGGLAGLLDQAGLGDSIEKAQLLAEMQKANFILQLEEARLRYVQLVAEGVLIGENKKLVEKVLGDLENFDLDKLFPPRSPGDDRAASRVDAYFKGADDARKKLEEEAKRQAQALDDAQKLREKYANAGEDPLARRLKEIRSEFDKIFESLGRGPENLELFRGAVTEVFDDLKKPVTDWLAQMGLSEESPLTAQQKLDLAGSQLDAIMERIRKGDLSAWQELPGAGNKALDLAGSIWGTAGEDYQALFERVRSMGAQAESLADAAREEYLRTGQLSFGNLSAIPLSSQVIIDTIAAGNRAAQDSAKTLAEIRSISSSQEVALYNMAADMASMKATNESLARELSMLRNSR